MMHTNTLSGNCPAREPPRRLARALDWLAPWARLRMRAADGGPPLWPMPWR